MTASISVQIVAGLVHDEYVRQIEQDEQQLHGASVRAGEVAESASSTGRIRKPRRSINVPASLAIHNVARLIAGKHFLDLVFAEFLQLIKTLREYGELHGFADVPVAHGRSNRNPVNQLQQCGLPAPFTPTMPKRSPGQSAKSHRQESRGRNRLACSRGDTEKRRSSAIIRNSLQQCHRRWFHHPCSCDEPRDRQQAADCRSQPRPSYALPQRTRRLPARRRPPGAGQSCR